MNALPFEFETTVVQYVVEIKGAGKQICTLNRTNFWTCSFLLKKTTLKIAANTQDRSKRYQAA